MFSKGTFQRYLFEIDSRQQKMLDLYTKLAAQTTEPAVRDVIAGFVDGLQGERKIVGDIRATLEREA